jgi:alpha-glucosidase
MERFRAVVDARPGRMTVGELFAGTTERAASLTRDHHLVFDWELLTRRWSARAFRAAIRRRVRAFGPDRWPTIVFSNHDQPRHASRLAASVAGGADRDAVARAAALLALTMRGTPFLYYGEEIGLGDVDIPPGESIDAASENIAPDHPWWDRSPARTPMPWDGRRAGGFTSGRPWLRLNADRATRNVRAQSADPSSVLSTYRRLLALRQESDALQVGELHLARSGHDDVLCFWRTTPAEPPVFVAVNFSGSDTRITVPRTHRDRRVSVRTVAGTHLEPSSVAADGGLSLRPFEGIVARA